MPMIVDPSAPLIAPPAEATSPDGWLTATLDADFAGVVLSVDYSAGTPLTGRTNVRQVRIVRGNPDGTTVPVRSADPAWAIEGVGRAYDHEAPLGVSVAWYATPIYADGSTGPTSSVALIVPSPAGEVADVWVKHLDEPSLSTRVTVVSWPALSYASRIDQSAILGSRFPALAQDEYLAPTSSMALDAYGPGIEAIRIMLRTGGVFLIQSDPDNHRPDQFVMFGDFDESIDAEPTGARTFTCAVIEVDRPDTADQPMRLPAWSIDRVAATYSTISAVTASYASVVELATNGVG